MCVAFVFPGTFVGQQVYDLGNNKMIKEGLRDRRHKHTKLTNMVGSGKEILYFNVYLLN